MEEPEPPSSPKSLAERECKPLALEWIAAALEALETPEDALTQAALATNFAWRTRPDEAHGGGTRPELARIAEMFRRVRAILLGSRKTFASVTRAYAEEIFRTRNIPPAYAVFGDRVYLTPEFAPFDAARARGFGPLCRTNWILHESVHLVDPSSGREEVHVPEWDEPRFSSLTLEAQLANPSAYASFAAQIASRAHAWPVSARFGAGNPER